MFSSDLNKALHLGISERQVSVVKDLLENGLDPNVKNEKQETALYCAAGKGDLEICQLLISFGANINYPDLENHTPLFFAVLKGHPCVAKYLLESGADPNLTDNLGWTPLHYAASFPFGSLEMCQLLVSSGANVNFPDRANRTPFLVAVLHYLQSQDFYGNCDIALVKYFLENGADTKIADNNNFSALNYAAFRNSLKIFLLIVLYRMKNNFDRIKKFLFRDSVEGL